MMPPPYFEENDRHAIGLALGYFLSNRIEEGRAALVGLRPELLECLYTAGLRLGIEAHALTRCPAMARDGSAALCGARGDTGS